MLLRGAEQNDEIRGERAQDVYLWPNSRNRSLVLFSCSTAHQANAAFNADPPALYVSEPILVKAPPGIDLSRNPGVGISRRPA